MYRYFLCFVLLATSAFAEQSASYWDVWLHNEGFYLLSPEQKEQFKKLSDPERELFVKNMWVSLDPDPITPENEFKADYEKRFAYAKKHYGIPSDRAKIYLLLGAPNSVESHENSDKYYPLELWSYYSLGIKGLPPSLDLIFFKRWGAGDYRLYSPLFDGFKALNPSGDDPESSPRARQQIMQGYDPQILEAAQRITVGASINESETVRMVLDDPQAIRHILTQKQKPIVETTVVYQGFDADVYTHSVPFTDGTFRTSIAIAVPPKYLTFEKTDDIYKGRVDLLGKISDEKGNEVLSISDSPFMKMNESEFDKAKGYIFAYQFDSYLLPGKYHLECLYRDYASNAAGKIEKSFEVDPISDDLEMLQPLLAYKATSATSEQNPFSYGTKQYAPKENSTFGMNQIVYIHSYISNPKKTKMEGIWQMKISILKGDSSVMDVTEDLPFSSSDTLIELVRGLRIQNLIPGSYTLSLQLSRDAVHLQSQTPLKITDQPEELGRMRIIAPYSAAPENYHTNLALQFYNQNRLEDAARHVRIALDFAPSSYPARALSARIQKAQGNTDAAISAYELLIQENGSDMEGMYLLGKWYLEKQNWQKASENLKKAMDAGYYTTDMLNCLAKSELQLGKTAEAVGYWQKSLAINANQPDIQKELQQQKQ